MLMYPLFIFYCGIVFLSRQLYGKQISLPYTFFLFNGFGFEWESPVDFFCHCQACAVVDDVTCERSKQTNRTIPLS